MILKGRITDQENVQLNRRELTRHLNLVRFSAARTEVWDEFELGRMLNDTDGSQGGISIRNAFRQQRREQGRLRIGDGSQLKRLQLGRTFNQGGFEIAETELGRKLYQEWFSTEEIAASEELELGMIRKSKDGSQRFCSTRVFCLHKRHALRDSIEFGRVWNSRGGNP